MGLESDQLISCPVINDLLGTTSSFWSQSVMVVALILILVTIPLILADRDRVPYTDGPLKQNDKPRNKISEDFLQAKA